MKWLFRSVSNESSEIWNRDSAYFEGGSGGRGFKSYPLVLFFGRVPRKREETETSEGRNTRFTTTAFQRRFRFKIIDETAISGAIVPPLQHCYYCCGGAASFLSTLRGSIVLAPQRRSTRRGNRYTYIRTRRRCNKRFHFPIDLINIMSLIRGRATRK